MLKLKLHWQILIAMLAAVVAGHLTGTDSEFLGLRFFDAYAFVGTLFLNALKMIVVPLGGLFYYCGYCRYWSQ